MTTLKVVINGQTCEVPVGMSIVATLALVGSGVTHRSVSGQLRAPLCGMGVCQEYRITVNGHRMLARQAKYRPEMVIEGSHHAKHWLWDPGPWRKASRIAVDAGCRTLWETNNNP